MKYIQNRENRVRVETIGSTPREGIVAIVSNLALYQAAPTLCKRPSNDPDDNGSGGAAMVAPVYVLADYRPRSAPNQERYVA